MSAARWQNILVVVTDPFGEEQPALTKAAAIARRCGGNLTLFNGFTFPQPVASGPYASSEAILASAAQQRHQRLKKLATGLRLQKTAKWIVRWDHPPHEAIVREVLQSKPDVLITGSHRHSLWESSAGRPFSFPKRSHTNGPVRRLRWQSRG
jgi:nucleotide-binding universal stress UspA family protein